MTVVGRDQSTRRRRWRHSKAVRSPARPSKLLDREAHTLASASCFLYASIYTYTQVLTQMQTRPLSTHALTKLKHTVIVAVSVSKARVAPLGVPGPASFLRPAHTHALSAAMLTKIARKSPTAALTQAIKDAEHAKRLAHSYSHAFSHIPLPPWPFVRRRSAPRRPAHDTHSHDHTRTGMEAQGARVHSLRWPSPTRATTHTDTHTRPRKRHSARRQKAFTSGT